MPTPPSESSEAATAQSAGSGTVTRRGVLGAVGAVAAAAAFLPPAGAAGASERLRTRSLPGTRTVAVPAVRSQTVTGAVGAASLRAGFPLHSVGVSWAGPRRGGRIRFRRQDGSLSDWLPLRDGCDGGRDGKTVPRRGAGGDTTVTALVPADGAVECEVLAPNGAFAVQAVALDTVSGPRRTVAVPRRATTFLGLDYVSRAAWGADESLRFKAGVENSPVQFSPAQALTVHHTEGANGDRDPAATIRAIYRFHAVERDWGDIGYHFLIDEAGLIYEGRWSGTDSAPAHDGDGNVVTGFHSAGFNSGNLGVSLLGTLTERQPTARARTSLVALLAALARHHRLDPAGSIAYLNPISGAGKKAAAISGHRDWVATDCPGGAMYSTLAGLRADVARQT